MNFKRLIKTSALERRVLIMNFISISMSSWYLPYCVEIIYYEEDIMRGTFNCTLNHSHLVSLGYLLGTVILPQDIRDARMVWLTGTSTGAPKSAQMVLASDIFYKVNPCLPQQTREKAVKGIRTAGKAVKRNLAKWEICLVSICFPFQRYTQKCKRARSHQALSSWKNPCYRWISWHLNELLPTLHFTSRLCDITAMRHRCMG